MSIFDRPPANWQQLQNMVGQLFAEIGCSVAVGQVLENVRGAKEIDVLVQDRTVVPNAVYLAASFLEVTL